MKVIFKSLCLTASIFVSMFANAESGIYTIESVGSGYGSKANSYQGYLSFSLKNRDIPDAARVNVFLSFYRGNSNLSYNEQLALLPEDKKDANRCGSEVNCFSVHYPLEDYSYFLKMLESKVTNLNDNSLVVQFDDETFDFQLSPLAQ